MNYVCVNCRLFVHVACLVGSEVVASLRSLVVIFASFTMMNGFPGCSFDRIFVKVIVFRYILLLFLCYYLAIGGFVFYRCRVW